MNHRPIIQDINNGQLNAIKAMPIKDSTSDGTSTFEMDRKAYMRTYDGNTTNLALKPAHLGIHSNNFNPTVFDGTHVAKQKQWYGNRDSSEVTRNRRVNSVGNGTLNAQHKTMGFTTHNDINVRSDALRRVRAGGAVAPPKKAVNVHHAYTPTPAYKPIMLKSHGIYGIKNPTLYH
jgi:hypothetical protein